MAARLSRSLCSGIGGKAAAVEHGALHFAYRALPALFASAAAWRPARLESGRFVAFHGQIANRPALESELGLRGASPERLYGSAVERWGDEADGRIIGEYCAIIADPAHRTLRLSRSPLRAPPLHYHVQSGFAAAASVPRALFAAGAPRRLNETRLADAALYNFSNECESWFEDIARVPLGSVVELGRGRAAKVRKFYDILSLPEVRCSDDRECIEHVSTLLDDGVKAALEGSKRPGATLSGGLDSPQIALRALRSLPHGRALPTFTFHPEQGWDGISEPATTGDEREFVRAFAAMHPGIEPHFTANEGLDHNHRCQELFHLMGGATPGMTNMYAFHGIWRMAQEQGCDLLLQSEWGNYTFSDNGQWAFVEYLLKGRWGQLWRALKMNRGDPRSMARRFLALSCVPLLPDSLWRALMRLWHPSEKSALDLICPLTHDYRVATGAEARMRSLGPHFDRYQPHSHRHALELVFASADSETAEVFQGFEQLYGIPQRDPSAYRPLVEFCCGLPTGMFLRDGEARWLAKQLARGVMPEEQARNLRNGRWDADWHLRIGRKRKEYLAELEQIGKDERLAEKFDTPRLRAALEDFPKQTTTNKQATFPIEFAVPRALLLARFINYVEGRNAP